MTSTAGRALRLLSACLATIFTLAPARAGGAPRLPYAVRAWTIADGLPTSTVQDIAQTFDGYLWLTTTGGLARFDGVRFTVFGLADGLSSNRFRGLAVDHAGMLWISAEDGTLIARKGNSFAQWPTGSTREAAALLALPDGSLIGAGYRHYWVWQNGACRQLPVDVDSTTAPVADAAGRIWLTAGSGTPARRAGDRLEIVGTGRRGDHWIVDQRDGAPRFVRRHGADAELLDTSLNRIALLEGAAEENVQDIDREGQLWSLAGDGVVARDARSGAVLGRLSLGLTSTRGKMFFDRQDNIWVGTLQQGLIRLSRSPVTLLHPEGLPGPMAFQCAREDLAGDIITWDASGNVWQVEGSALHALSPATVEHLRFGSPRLIYGWAGSYIELRDSTGAGGIVPVQRIWQGAILADPVHPLSAVLHSEAPTQAISAAPGRPPVRVLLPAEPFSRDAMFDHVGRLWVATVSGLWRLAPGDSQHFTRRDGLPADHLRQLHEDADGTVWIGTYGGGLARFKDGKFATLDHRKGLLEDVVSTVLEDDDGNLWLAGNAGIQRIKRAEADECLDGRRPRVLSVGYGRDAGLLNPETTGYPGSRSRDGRLWFGTFDGLAVVDPRLARASRGAPPSAVIEEVRAGDRALSPRAGGGFVLAPGQRRFEVRYTGLDLRAPEQLRFRYRLDGVDRDWIDAGEARIATYTNVPPGRHVFRLVAINGDGAASPAPVTALLDVEPRLWERLPVQALALLLLLGALAWGWRRRSAGLVARAAALERAVGERTAEVVEAKSRIETALTTVEAQATRLEAQDRARSRFFASVSHEFRTPLTLIQGPLADVTSGEHGPLTDDARAQVGIALDSATRLHRLVDQLLDAARAEAGELRLERAPGDLNAFLADLAQAFAPLAERKRIAFEREFPAGPLAASFDPLALEKVFANLLGNAFKFTPEGGHVWWRAARVDDGSAAGAVDIAVVDDGPGIAAEDLPHIFRHFYRSERSVTREQPGTGLGLALAHDMVDKHGGALRVESREGHGATFTVRLPLIAATALPAPAPALDAAAATALADEIRMAPEERETAIVPGDAPLVLVVEDNPDVRAYVTRRLGQHYRVAAAGNGEQALASMRETLPDLVVSDLAMPVMDGLALCRAVRADPELEFVPVILLSAAAETDSRVRGLEGGADDYVTKPFEVRELLARIARMLQSRRRLRDHLARAAATEAVLGPAAPVPAPVDGASKVDSAFVRRVREVVAARLGDEDFGVDELAESMGMGRTLLYQRTRELLGDTPMELLMSRRLERAAEILAAGEGNVGEVAYAVGFRSVAHFTHRFSERFSVTPSAWRRGARPTPSDSPAVP